MQRSPNQTRRVTTAGLHIVDILGRHVDGVPDGQGVELIEEIRMTVAGTAAATAIDLAKLGIEVATFGVVGNDELGSWLRSKMDSVGIDTAGITSVSTHPTSATILPIRPNGERPALHVQGANALLEPEHIPGAALCDSQVVHIGGSCLLPLLDGQPTAKLLETARAAGAATTLDLIGMPDADHEAIFGPCYPHLDYFLPNDEDAHMISGTSSIRAAAAWFADRGVGTSLISLGADGVFVSVGSNDGTIIPAFDVDVVDTTGCGDAFSAGFIAGLVEGRDVLEAAELGVAAGSLVATGLGSDAGISDREALDEFISSTDRRPTVKL